MNRTLRALAVFLGIAALVALAAPQPTQGQDKKDKDKKAAKWAPAVDFTKQSGKDWIIKETKLGHKMVSDKDYVITALPKDLVGSTYLQRTAGDHGQWLPDLGLTAKKDGTAYAMVRVKLGNKETFGELAQAQFAKDGWKEVEGKVATSTPKGENWEWKLFKKDIKEGDLSLPLENLKWPGTAVLFFFK